MSEKRSSGTLLAIAVFKLVKAAVLIAVGVGALSLIHDRDTETTLRHVLNVLRVDPNNYFFNRALSSVLGLDRRKLAEIGVGTFVYAAVFLVEGTGLLLRKTWAEYLTTIVTASFVPLEVYEMVRRASVLKALGIAVNVAIVVYLVLRLRQERRERHAPSGV
ncbi:MAG TPA: DUF2127 domain-containing protein [Polyangiaceae bacterium]|nr:DUF2127 domain-containing protein [Polyangiaceae bacterium]